MESSKYKFVILSAPSGSGKTTLANALIRKYPNFVFSVSATTRSPRDYERDGVHYYFLSKEDFKERIEEGDFLEYEEVYEGRYYGTLKSEIERISQEGKIPLLDIDVVGGSKIKETYHKDALAIFVQAPSLEVLQERLEKRNSDTSEEIQKRISKANYEMTFREKFDLTIVNEDLETATDELCEAAMAFLKE
ncbi:MAG: guanylate kinase [Bacteroidia bacterium]|nr:guanylate kinase [Bacteroidia bacterium]